MTEIEKMYENANAYKMLCNCEFKNLFDYSIVYGQDVCIHAEDEIMKGCGWCELCELAERNVKFYPPFTAEKQLELIKWLIQKNIYDERIIRSNFEKTYFFCVYDDYFESEYFGKFEEALASVFNYFWQDLTDQEKEEIRRILNENS